MKYLSGMLVLSMFVWSIGIALQKYVFMIENDLLLMIYGFIVGSVVMVSLAIFEESKS
jgi:hypothetical protein